MKRVLTLCACTFFVLACATLPSSAAGIPGGIPAVLVTGASIGSGQWPVLKRWLGYLSPLSETTAIAGYLDLATVLTERAYGRLRIINVARAGTTSHDLPDGRYDAVGDGSIPHWPGLRRQFERGYQSSLAPDGQDLTATATHLFIGLPDDCYYAEDYAVPGCVSRMITHTESAVSFARGKDIVVIVQLQNDLEDLDVSGVPGLITPAQYQALADAWQAAFTGREDEKVFTINLYREAGVEPGADLLDGVHLRHGAMVRAADRLLALIAATSP